RLDYFEIDPRHRRGSLGLFAFAVAGTRALELDAQYLVFGALPPVATFYERAGGARGAVPGWNVARGLIPFRFTRDALSSWRILLVASRSVQKKRELFLALVRKVGPLPTSALVSAESPPRGLVRSTQDTSVQLATRVPKSLHRSLRLHCVRAGVSLMEVVVH